MEDVAFSNCHTSRSLQHCLEPRNVGYNQYQRDEIQAICILCFKGILRQKLGRSDDNIKPITTSSGRRYEVMYYPWEGAQPHILWKMNHRWNFWNKTLHKYRRTNMVQMRTITNVHDLKIKRLLNFWKGFT